MVDPTHLPASRVQAAVLTSVADYRLIEQIGGGMASVYRAQNSLTLEHVAVKVAHSGPGLAESMRREVDVLSRMPHHPGIVRLLDHGLDRGLPWYAMELIQGPSLRDLVRTIWAHGSARVSTQTTGPGTESVSSVRRRAPECDAPHVPRPHGALPAAGNAHLRQVLLIGRRIADALAFLHGENLVHCDLKPENILLRGDQPVIIDFGLAFSHPGSGGREVLEAAQHGAGTRGYMAPEQLRGEFLDARADLYALGCILYELVTGERAFWTGTQPSDLATLRPIAPSLLVNDLSSALEELILDLIKPTRDARTGYADEVAARLAEACQDVVRVPGTPPARAYLYRPSLRDRNELLDELRSMQQEACAGSGQLVLLGGESGAGKTRLAMELTRRSQHAAMRVVTSECSTLGAAGAGGRFAPAPLHALKPVLRRMADYCSQGGPARVNRVFGSRLSVLAMYEPALQQLGPPEMAPALPSPAARERLFRYLGESIAAFAMEHPLAILIDDLSWADELSLAALRCLDADYLRKTPVFILGTYRIEEETASVRALRTRADVRALRLPRLSRGSVRSIIADMLATKAPDDEFVDLVSEHAEGNPFFAAEFLRTAVSEHVVYRDETRWVLPHLSRLPGSLARALSTPNSVRGLISRRMTLLGSDAQLLAQTASVLGRTFEQTRLRSACALPDDRWRSAIDELCMRQVLEYTPPLSLRFVHDKIREVAYDQIPLDRLRELHLLAATSLEAQWNQLDRPSGMLSSLAHHYASGGAARPAATYLAAAADYARSIFANDEAIHLYREALGCATQLLFEQDDTADVWRSFSATRAEELGDLLMLVGQRERARSSYTEALSFRTLGEAVETARLHRKLGKSWEFEHDHGRALAAYDLADGALASAGRRDQIAGRQEWVQVRLERLWIQYWQDDVPGMKASLAELRPVISIFASPAQQSRFFTSLFHMAMRRERYAISEQTLEHARDSVRTCAGQSSTGDELPMAQFHLGLALLLRTELSEAAAEFTRALAQFELAGNVTEQARVITYLALTVRRMGDAQRLEPLVDKSMELTVRARMRDYVGAAHANQAWLALAQGDQERAQRCATDALQVWSELASVYPYPFQWTALVPLLEVSCAKADHVQCVKLCQQLLEQTQLKLSDGTERALWRVINERREEILTRTREALSLLRVERYV